MAVYLQNVLRSVQLFEHSLLCALGLRLPPDHHALAIAAVSPIPKTVINESDLSSLLKDHILWAAPKKRRSLQVRRCRKYGWPDRVWKLMVSKTNILICNKCGGYKEAGLLCPTCYSKIRLETEEMQEAIQKELGLSPVDKEVVVLYDGEKSEESKEFWQGKRIVEMKKERPPMFSKNLLQPTTQGPATTSDVKPTELA